jgi:hypothetical protein
MLDVTHAFFENVLGKSSYEPDDDPEFGSKLERLTRQIPYISAAELEEDLKNYEGDYHFVRNLYL